MEKTKKTLSVWVDVSQEERQAAKLFFSFRGMIKSFLDEYPAHTRKKLDGFLKDSVVKKSLLVDVRSFIEEHKDEVAEFIHSEDAA